MLNELFTAEIPYGTNYKTIGSVTEDYAYLDPLVEKMIEQNPESRYTTIDDLKKELVAAGEEHITRQKLSQLENIVIPTNEIDDILIYDPMRIINVDWENNKLTIELNHPVNSNWVWAIKNIGGYRSLLGKGPENFQYRKNMAIIATRSDEVQLIVDYFKQWLPRANQVYENKLRQDQEADERRQLEELQKLIQKEKERLDVLRNLKF